MNLWWHIRKGSHLSYWLRKHQYEWYQASQANAYKSGITAGTQLITAENPEATSHQNIYLKLNISLASTSLDLTTLDGQSMGVTNQGIQAWYTPDHPYESVTLTAAASNGAAATQGSTYGWQWFTDAECKEEADANAINDISAGSAKVYASTKLGVNEYTRVRLITGNPAEEDVSSFNVANVGEELTSTALTNSKKFYHAFNGSLGAQDVEIGELNIAEHGTVSGTLKFYYSIAGENPDVIRHDCNTSELESTIDADKLTITFALETK